MADVAVGTIVVWPSASAVPTGWQICDGTNGTPDLRDRFVPCVGTDYSVGEIGGGAGGGAIPSHMHTVSGNVTTERTYTMWSPHRHLGTINVDMGTPPSGGVGSGLVPSPFAGGLAAAHTHAWTVTTMTGYDHQHAISGETGAAEATASAENYPPWIALYYIQRLS